jgi:predicted nucleic acid-binding protein
LLGNGVRFDASVPVVLETAWAYFERPDLHKLSAVDAVSFVLMTQRRIRAVFAFDSRFATAGFRMVACSS